MIVRLFDKTELVVSKADGDKLNKSLMRSTDGMVTINGYLIKKSAIAYTKPGGYTQADLPPPNDPNKRLKSDNRSDDEQYKAARKASEIARKNLFSKKAHTKPQAERVQ